MLEAKHSVAPTQLKDDQYFELFLVDQVLRSTTCPQTSSSTDSAAGGNDGGIDGLYTFAGDQLLEGGARVGCCVSLELNLVVLQSKRSEGFGEKAIQLIEDTLVPPLPH